MSLKPLYINTLVVAALILGSFGFEVEAKTTSAAFAGIQVSVPTTNNSPNGSTVSIPVTLTNSAAKAISGGAIDITYDPNVLQPLGPDTNIPAPAPDTTGTLTASCGGVTQATSPISMGTQTIGVSFGNCNITGSGILIRVRFTVVGTANSPTSTSALTVGGRSFEGPMGEEVTATTAPGGNGVFTVTGTTAASVTVTGRVLTTQGRGLKGAQVRLTTADGTTRTVMSSAFGNYRFANVQAGQTVTIEIFSKRYGFQPRTVNLSGDVSDINFIAEP